MKTLQKKNGFTLIELLISVGLGLALSAIMTATYLNNSQNYLQDEEVARMQENARYALSMLKRELTMAGFMAGSADYSTLAATAVSSDCVSSGNWALDTSQAIELVNNYTSGAVTTLASTQLNCIDASQIVVGTHIVTVKRSADRHTLKNGVLNTSVVEDSKQWYLKLENSATEISWHYLADAAVFNNSDKIPGSQVDYWEYYSRIFYIRNHSLVDGDEIPTLCMEQLVASSMSSDCYVEGIEDLQIEVGIDTTNDGVPDLFKATPDASELAQALVLRVYILARSINEVPGYTNSKSYQLGTKSLAAKNDGFVRRVFSTTVQMRNAHLPNA